MPVNNYFRNFNSAPQQDLLNDLTREVIEINGVDVYYVVKTLTDDLDEIYNEQPTAVYTNTRKIEMYIDTPEGFEGAGDMVSKFGLDVQDEIRFIVNKDRFIQEVDIGSPREGDLIYLPLGKGLYEIKWVEHEKPFYTLGRNSVYQVTAELFRYNNQAFDIPSLEQGILFDKIEREHAITQRLTVGTSFTDTDKFKLSERIVGQTSAATAKVAKMDAGTNLDVYRVSGQFQNGETITGATHTNTIVTQDEQVMVTSEFDDNKILETDGDNILDFSEIDPWSEGQY